MIDTHIVYGFADAGKTTYIRDCIMNDYFYKYGTTLILCFEQGKESYDEEALLERNTHVSYYRDHQNIGDFCSEAIDSCHPGRIYVEMNTKLPSIRRKLPEVMNVTSTVTRIDWSAIDSFFAANRQLISQMVSESQQITFRGCPSRELLAPYSQDFRLMNHKASYLRQDPMGYHEKAFDLFVPYSLEKDEITISAKDYLIFWLDAADHPEHYEGKLLCFPDPLELRHVKSNVSYSAGRVVMTCCMADLQFMSFELTATDKGLSEGGWITMEAFGRVTADEYGRKVLKLEPEQLSPAAAPESAILLPGGKKLTGPSVSPAEMFQRMNSSRSRGK